MSFRVTYFSFFPIDNQIKEASNRYLNIHCVEIDVHIAWPYILRSLTGHDAREYKEENTLNEIGTYSENL